MLRLSRSVTFKSGRRIFIGSPGKPAPVPTSMTLAPSGSFRYFKTSMLSKKCFTATSRGAVIEVRFTFSFHSRSESI